MDINREFEYNVAKYFQEQGYVVDVTRAVGDWGVDVFIQKEGYKCAVQVKNYGNCKTRISRKDIMELYGAMVFFDCNSAKIVYNGGINKDAIKVAEKLNIECIYLENNLSLSQSNVDLSQIADSFKDMWNLYILPLKGQEIVTKSHKTYFICDVTDGDVSYINTNGKKNKVKIDLFRQTYYKIKNQGIIHGKDIRDEFKTHHSSLIVALYSLVPYFEILNGPYIKLKTD